MKRYTKAQIDKMARELLGIFCDHAKTMGEIDIYETWLGEASDSEIIAEYHKVKGIK